MNHYFTNEKLESNLKEITVNIKDKKFIFYSDNGVFSKKGMDFGSRTLVNALLDLDLKGTLLDLGCGYGVIGIILSSFFHLNVDMVDINKRAIHLANENIKKNNCKDINASISNIYDAIDKKYDYIVTNPPIRVGKEILYKFIFDASKYLNKNGILFFVINKDQGAKSLIKDLSEKAFVEVIEKNKGFFVIKCIFN